MKKTLFLALLSIGLIRVAAASDGNAYGHEKDGNAYAYGHDKAETDSGVSVPEINSGAAAMALALLVGGALVLRGRRKPQLE